MTFEGGFKFKPQSEQLAKIESLAEMALFPLDNLRRPVKAELMKALAGYKEETLQLKRWTKQVNRFKRKLFRKLKIVDKPKSLRERVLNAIKRKFTFNEV